MSNTDYRTTEDKILGTQGNPAIFNNRFLYSIIHSNDAKTTLTVYEKDNCASIELDRALVVQLANELTGQNL